MVFRFITLLWAFSFTSLASDLTQVPYADVLTLPGNPPDQTRRYGNDASQFVHGWLSDSSAKADIVFIHGGCWLSAFDIEHSLPSTSALAEAGYNVWSIEYRRTGETGGGWPVTFNDIETAYQMLVANGHVNPSRTLLMGHSAGGHLAMLLAGKGQVKVAGVVGLAAITDIERYAVGDNSCQQATPAFMGGKLGDKVGDYVKANPMRYSLHNNTWLLTGTADNIVPDVYLYRLNGLPANRVINVKDAGHFDFIHTQTLAWQQILNTLQQAAKAL